MGFLNQTFMFATESCHFFKWLKKTKALFKLFKNIAKIIIYYLLKLKHSKIVVVFLIEKDCLLTNLLRLNNLKTTTIKEYLMRHFQYYYFVRVLNLILNNLSKLNFKKKLPRSKMNKWIYFKRTGITQNNLIFHFFQPFQIVQR